MVKNTGKNFENEVRRSLKAGKIMERHGGLSFFLIRRDEPRNKTCYAVTPSQVEHMYRSFGKSRKSVPWKWLDENCTKVERLAKPIRWHLVNLYEEYM